MIALIQPSDMVEVNRDAEHKFPPLVHSRTFGFSSESPAFHWQIILDLLSDCGRLRTMLAQIIALS